VTERRLRNPDGSLPPGSYTRETLPPPTPEVQEILDGIKAAAKKWSESPQGKATRLRAEEARKKGGLGAFIAVMLGAR
jgi:hypothetical protein